MYLDCTRLPPNPEMQPTSRTDRRSAGALTADGDQRNEELCGRELDGLQLISIPLGRPEAFRSTTIIVLQKRGFS